MGRPAVKANKKKPASANKVRLFVGRASGGFTVYWKGRATPKRRNSVAPAKPRARRWANLVVYVDDPTQRKRSFHIAWNGERFNETLDATMLDERLPDVWDEVHATLPRYNYRLIRE